MRGTGALVLVLLASCRRPYQPAGASPPLNATGTYAVRETLYSSTCSGMAARKEVFRVEVQQPINGRTLKLIVEGLPYDAQLNSGGEFSTPGVVVPRGRITTTTAIGGRFSNTGFAGRVSIKTVEQIAAARPGEPTTRFCEYQLRWEGQKQ